MSRGRWIGLAIAAAAAATLAWWLLHKGGGGERAGVPEGMRRAAPAAGSAGPGAAATRAALGGKVVDEKGAAIAGAVVRLAPVHDRDGDPLAVASGGDGGYGFDDLAPGRWHVSAAAPGFLPADGGEVALAPGERRTLALTLVLGGRALHGTVTDATGGPIAGVRVDAARERGAIGGVEPGVAAAFTDAAGRYAMNVAEGSYQVDASHAEYVGERRHVEVGPGGAAADFALVPGGAIEGTVADAATGQGVAGARVDVARQALAGGPGAAMQATRGRTSVVADASGHFRVAGLEPGAIALTASAPGRASKEPTLVPLGVAEQVTGVTVVVQAAASISGVVVDEGGAPVADATAYLLGPGDVRDEAAGPDGRFTIEGVEPGRYQIAAAADGHLPGDAVPVEVAGAPVTGVKVVVKRGAMIRGHVEPAGAAHVEVPIDLEHDGPMDLLSFVRPTVDAEAGADGAFALGPVVPGAITVAARAADGRRGKVALQVPAGGLDGVVIHLDAGATLSGRVTDGKDPVAGATVSVRRIKAEGRTAVIVNGVDALADRAPTDGDGRFAVAGLAAGDYEVQVLDERGSAFAWRAPADAAHPARPLPLTLAQGEARSLALEIERPHGVIRGVVLGADGKPVADAWVSASRGLDDLMMGLAPPLPGGGGGAPPAGGAGGGSGGDAPAEGGSRMIISTSDGGDDGGIFGGVPPVLTGPDGRFALEHLRRGTYQLIAEGAKGGARGFLDKVEPDADVTVHLATLTALTGNVTAGGAPVDDFTVELDGPARRSQRFLTAAGHFTMQRIDPGTYDVTITAKAGTGHAQVTIAAGDDAHVDVALVGHGRIVGKVVDATGAPAAGLPVVTTAMQPGGQLTVSIDGPPDTTGPDGSFAIDAEPGARMLIVLGSRGPVVTKTIQVTGGQTLDLGTISEDAAPPHRGK